MSFLKKLFGGRDPLERMRQYCERKEWAAALNLAEETDWDSLAPGAGEAAEELALEAGDRLAELNLLEGEHAAATGNSVRCREHFQLALTQVRSDSLREKIESALAGLDGGTPGQAAAPAGDPVHGSCGSDCGPACGPAARPAAEDGETDLDEEGRIELYLGTLPGALADRYAASSPEFLRAWLESQDGDPQRALDLLAQVPEEGQEALFFSERGALRIRCGDLPGGEEDLQTALSLDPDLLSAFESMTDLLTASDRGKELEEMLKEAIARGRHVAPSWSGLAKIYAGRGDLQEALAAGTKALAAGSADFETLVVTARLLEQKERYDEAEALLERLPGGGCGGGAHPLLAEFLLRREKNLDRALESFKGALRQERDNPRWALRIGQTYLARGWQGEAAEQFDRLLARQDLPEGMRDEVLGSMARMTKT